MSILNCYLLKENQHFNQIIAETAKQWNCMKLNIEDARKLQFWNCIEECYIKSTDKIWKSLCWNHMYEPIRVQNLIKYAWKQPSFTLDLNNVEMSLLSKFHRNATISSGVIVQKWLVGRTHGRTDPF